MATIEERFEMIQQSVMAQAEEEAEKLRNQAKDLRNTAMKQAEEEVTRELSSREQDEVAEIRVATTRSVSQKENTQRRELLLRREEITRTVFEAVKKRLADYVKTSDYPRFLEETAKGLSEKCPKSGTVVMLRPDDLSLGKQWEGCFGADVQVVEDESIKIGGLKVVNRSSGLFLDETLDGRLEDQKSWFYANSGLTVG